MIDVDDRREDEVARLDEAAEVVELRGGRAVLVDATVILRWREAGAA